MIEDYYDFDSKKGMIYCDRCLKYWPPESMSHVIVKEVNRATKKLNICPNCMAVINASLYLKHKV